MSGTQNTPIEEFLSPDFPLLDVRSPSEFARGHIPGAINVYLLDDRSRHEVGIVYAQKGIREAVRRGLALSRDRLPEMFDQMAEISNGKPLRIYCWRGGLRSRAAAFLAESAGIRVMILKGGYRAFRQYAISCISMPRRLIILGGMTGSGKTEMLQLIQRQGAQVLDLEGLAHHKGSVFGGIGQSAQPSTEQFSNLIWAQLATFDPAQPVWVEDESNSLGNCFVPDALFSQMLRSPVIELRVPRHVRAARLYREYGLAGSDLLAMDVMKIKKRLGLKQAAEICRMIEDGQTFEAATLLLQYYDKAYHICLSRRNPDSVFPFECDTRPDAGELLAFAARCLTEK